jgi:putative ABC transport system permease protein
MSVFRIAWRSITHRGLGSWLTILSMALGVMLVVSVLSIHGVISESFRANSSYGYNIVVGARGGALQLTMNTVFYLSKPVENIPYEFYLAFCDRETRGREMVNSFAYQAFQHEMDSIELAAANAPGNVSLAARLAGLTINTALLMQELDQTQIDKNGLYSIYTELAIPLCLGDTFEVSGTNEFFRCIGTNRKFFDELILDIDAGAKFRFAEGRCFADKDSEHGFHECVIGAIVANRSGLKIGDTIYPTHGDPSDSSAHIHEQGFTVVGILEGTRTPHDRGVFLNIDGFYLMEGHVKPVVDETALRGGDKSLPFTADPFAEDEEADDASGSDVNDEDDTDANMEDHPAKGSVERPAIDAEKTDHLDVGVPLPIEQREVTSILVRTASDPENEFGSEIFGMFLPAQINEGDLESSLAWSNFRPVRAQKAAQAINPVREVANFLLMFVAPISWLLLALTVMICAVSGISILVGIYNSMNQRKHEIAVMRALGAHRGKVMSITFVESLLLAIAGGITGWVLGHLLNFAIGPLVESQTGVGIGFFDFAPGVPLLEYLGLGTNSFLPDWLVRLNISPEFALIPGLILLAVLVGIYPAISAYRTDVAKSLGK